MKFIAGPMATLSHQAFRKCIEKFGGCDEYFTEMINASSFLNNGPFEKYYILNEVAPEKIVWQLTCHKPDPYFKATEILCQKGGLGIDLNMGCSAPQIANTGAGISWMKKSPDEIKYLVQNVKKLMEQSEHETGTHLRLSVKCRLGPENFTKETLLNFASLLFDCGVELITLHPRTQKDRARAKPQYEYVELLKNSFPQMTIYLNGDITDRLSLDHALSTSPSADGVMISRAAAQKPWIFSTLNPAATPPESIDMLSLALDFISDVQLYQPEQFWKTRLQRFFTYYCLNFQFAHYFQSSMLNASSPEDSILRLKDYFSRQPQEQILKLNKN